TTVVLVRLLVGRLVRTTAGVVLRVAERGDSDGLGELLAGGLCRESGARGRGALRRDALRLAGGVPGRAAAGHERGGCNVGERRGLQAGVQDLVNGAWGRVSRRDVTPGPVEPCTFHTARSAAHVARLRKSSSRSPLRGSTWWSSACPGWCAAT